MRMPRTQELLEVETRKWKQCGFGVGEKGRTHEEENLQDNPEYQTGIGKQRRIKIDNCSIIEHYIKQDITRVQLAANMRR